MTVQFSIRFVKSFVILILVGFISVRHQAVAQETAAEIQDLMENRDSEIKTLLDASESEASTRSRLKEVINGIIDFRRMGEVAIGPHWETISVQQRDSFVTVFAQIVRDQSISNLDIYRSKISYDNIEVDTDKAVVTTSTVYKDVPAVVVYHMRRNESTGLEWMAEDFVLDGVSTAQGYAKSFQTVIRKRGFNGLMSSLLKKQAQLNK